MAAAIVGAGHLLPPDVAPLWRLLVPLGVGLFTYPALSALLGSPEYSRIIERFRRSMKRP